MSEGDFGGADLHFHSTFSDGVETPERLVEMAVAAGLSVVALSDHDSLESFPRFQSAASAAGLVFLRAAELSTDLSGEDIHILAYFLEAPRGDFERSLNELRKSRLDRGEEMLSRLSSHGFPLDRDRILASASGGAFGRPHIARALVEGGHASSVEEAFQKFLQKGCVAYVPKRVWPTAEAIRSARDAGGITSLAHPVWYRDSMAVLDHAVAAGLHAIEVFHPDQEPEEEARFRAASFELGLLMTGGSDFHAESEGDSLGSRRLALPEWRRLEEGLRGTGQ